LRLETVTFRFKVSRVNHLATSNFFIVKLSYLYLSASTALSPPVDPTLQPGLRSSKSRYKNVVTAATSLTESFASNVSEMYVHCRKVRKQSLKLSYAQLKYLYSDSESGLRHRVTLHLCRRLDHPKPGRKVWSPGAGVRTTTFRQKTTEGPKTC